MRADKRHLSIGLAAVLLLAGAVTFGVNALELTAGDSSRRASRGAAERAVPSGGQRSTPALSAPATTLQANQRAGAASESNAAGAAQGADPSRFSSRQAELAFMRSRRAGEALQVRTREQSLALLQEALQAESSSGGDRRALEAREVRLYHRIEQHRIRLADTDQRIAALETSVDAAKKELP